MEHIKQYAHLLKRCRKRFRRTAQYIFRWVWVPQIESGLGKGMRFDAWPYTEGNMLGDYEYPVQKAVSSLLREGDVFYDIGANIGFFSIVAGRLVGSPGAVYAFEPVPKNASAVERNARLNRLGNIEVLRVAVSHRTEKSELMLARFAGGAVLKSAGCPPDFAGSMVIQTCSIDDLVNSKRIRPPDVVKIDVEGAELDVLTGMGNVLKEYCPKVIVEVDDADQKRCEEKMTACKEYLMNLHYSFEVLPESYKDCIWFVRHFCARREPANISSFASRVAESSREQ